MRTLTSGGVSCPSLASTFADSVVDEPSVFFVSKYIRVAVITPNLKRAFLLLGFQYYYC